MGEGRGGEGGEGAAAALEGRVVEEGEEEEEEEEEGLWVREEAGVVGGGGRGELLRRVEEGRGGRGWVCSLSRWVGGRRSFSPLSLSSPLPSSLASRGFVERRVGGWVEEEEEEEEEEGVWKMTCWVLRVGWEEEEEEGGGGWVGGSLQVRVEKRTLASRGASARREGREEAVLVGGWVGGWVECRCVQGER